MAASRHLHYKNINLDRLDDNKKLAFGVFCIQQLHEHFNTKYEKYYNEIIEMTNNFIYKDELAQLEKVGEISASLSGLKSKILRDYVNAFPNESDTVRHNLYAITALYNLLRVYRFATDLARPPEVISLDKSTRIYDHVADIAYTVYSCTSYDKSVSSEQIRYSQELGNFDGLVEDLLVGEQ